MCTYMCLRFCVVHVLSLDFEIILFIIIIIIIIIILFTTSLSFLDVFSLLTPWGMQSG